MTAQIFIIGLWFFCLFCSYQWGYSNGMTSTIDRDIILMLSDEQPMAALEILENLNFGRDKEIGFGSLFPALNRLEKQGLIVGDIKMLSTEDPQRKFYQLALYKPSNPPTP